MNTDNNEEALEFINRLLEQLQRAGDTNNGSKIELVYVASGGQHVETQVNIGAYPQPLPKGKGVGTPLPEALSTEAAMTLWKKAQAAAMAERLGIKEKWKVFETLWLRTKMYKDYYQALDQKQYLSFLDKLKQIFD